MSVVLIALLVFVGIAIMPFFLLGRMGSVETTVNQRVDELRDILN